ncbi:UDP-3-O-(3-hydroxymyristoyl)glucosamine N-acyltransferase [Oculatella sp. LEGE 06141]|uniref:UDP-3-O-(3-hydroxymyristoyl)glucosamine N-acyltransferase n=1 Tax=Oculatella sp. LEGE 06141 TaxID=1828648 RepID=UPI00187F5624|nr:UDP-3-O-(3-hydroxymyristoyl)glucosamine N-acyltransferase [Oculatella sp. LEGE 06141]MBE9178195.1 UDP-3-O-(3-hydroxymyristoyl)glucosamine N-acyltransferase [Oculatella sp. LEGE 06141]
MKFSELVQKLGTANNSSLNTLPQHDPEILGVSAIEAAAPATLSYIDGEKFASQVMTTVADALILPQNDRLQQQATDRQLAWLSTAHPRLVFAQAIALFYQPFRPAAGIHPTAVIDPSVRVGDRVSVGAHVVIQAGATIGNEVCIHPNVVVYPEVQIGDRTVLHANCVIHERTQIGADCVIHSGAAIGAEGFGFVPITDGWMKMEQSGYTVLEDGVEVGCNSAVDRPSVGETRIRRNTKLDNMVHIAHGCQIGEGCAMAAQVGLAGGVTVGNRVILGGQVGIANQARIGDGAQAGAKAGIHSNVEAGAVVMGSPALPYHKFLKASAIFSRLPDMHKALKQIQRHLRQTPSP